MAERPTVIECQDCGVDVPVKATGRMPLRCARRASRVEGGGPMGRYVDDPEGWHKLVDACTRFLNGRGRR